MSNYGLACMILDLVKKDFLSDITSGSSLERIASGTSSGNTSVSGDSSGSDDRGSVFPGKDDSGKLISCRENVVLESLETKELSQIKIVNQSGGDNIKFKYSSGDEFDWESGRDLGKGSFGEVKLFTLSDGKSVAIKKYPTWKFVKDEQKLITGVRDLSKSSNECEILKKIDEKCGPGEKEGEKCIRSCDIVPAQCIKSLKDINVFSINTELPASTAPGYSSREWPMKKNYSFIAMEAMDGSLRDYGVGQKNELDKLESDDDKRILLDKIFVNVTKIILEVAIILKCLSDKEYYYTDLKSDNVLYKCDGQKIIIKLGDIGGLTTEENLNNGKYVRTYYDPRVDGRWVPPAAEAALRAELGEMPVEDLKALAGQDGVPAEAPADSDAVKQALTELIVQQERRWISNLKYYHVYLLGYLYIELLKDIFGVKFGQESLKNYTNSTPNDKKIRKDINQFMGDIRENFPQDYLFTADYYNQIDCNRSKKNNCIGERFSVLIYEILHKTIVSQLELSDKGQSEIEGTKRKVSEALDNKAEPSRRIYLNRELIKKQHEYSFRYKDESELIKVLESFINKTNDDERGEEY
jgi:serine/threonine protein kinase